jgi:hypothetical protein
MCALRSPLFVLTCLLSSLVAGCTTPSKSNTPRTAVEQLLISNAVDQSLNKVDFRPFGGHAVHLSQAYMEAVDKPYIVGSVRHRLLNAGARLVEKPEEADIIVEIRSGGVGTNTAETFVGTPEVALPGMVTIPEMKVAERIQQTGMAKLGLVAYDAKTKEVLGTGGTSLSESTDNNWFVGGVGPFRGGSLKREITRATSGEAATTRNVVPASVAFTGPKRTLEEPQKIQFASGSEPAEE